jgi:hypothetical protein
VPRGNVAYAIPEWGVRAASYRAGGKNLGVSAGQLAGGQPTVADRINHGPGRDRETLADRPVTKCCRFAMTP